MDMLRLTGNLMIPDRAKSIQIKQARITAWFRKQANLRWRQWH